METARGTFGRFSGKVARSQAENDSGVLMTAVAAPTAESLENGPEGGVARPRGSSNERGVFPRWPPARQRVDRRDGACLGRDHKCRGALPTRPRGRGKWRGLFP